MRTDRAILSLLLLTFVACDGGGEKADPDPTNGVKDEAKEEVEAIADRREGRQKKDRGEGKAKIGGVDWSADSAKANVKGEALTLKLSNTEMKGGKVTRQELHLKLDGYKGPGEYTTSTHGSRFISVGMDTKKVEEAEAKDAAAGSDAETTKAVTDMLGNAGHMMIMGAKVTIDEASDTEIKGTFSYKSPSGEKQSMSDGSFRAIIPPPRE